MKIATYIELLALFSNESTDEDGVKSVVHLVEGQDISRSNNDEIFFRSDERKPQMIFNSGFTRRFANFQLWDNCLRKIGYDWRNSRGSDHANDHKAKSEISHMMLKGTIEEDETLIDCHPYSGICLTSNPFVAPHFPFNINNSDDELNFSKRFLYAIVTDTYCDAAAFEKKINAAIPAILYDEKITRDVPRGHVLAAIKIKIRGRTEDLRYESTKKGIFTYYEACGPIIWHIDYNNKLYGVPNYEKRRQKIEEKFQTLIEGRYWEIWESSPDENDAAAKSELTTKTISWNELLQLDEDSASYNQAQNESESKMESESENLTPPTKIPRYV